MQDHAQGGCICSRGWNKQIKFNTREVIPIHCTLIGMGRPQPPTTIKSDNSIAINFLVSNLKQKKSKLWDMRLNWLWHKHILDKQCTFYWTPGTDNSANYHTKHHPPKHHLKHRYKHVLAKGHQKHTSDPVVLCDFMPNSSLEQQDKGVFIS